MKMLVVLMLGLFALSCASFSDPERDLASQDEQSQSKKDSRKPQNLYRGSFEHR